MRAGSCVLGAACWDLVGSARVIVVDPAVCRQRWPPGLGDQHWSISWIRPWISA